VLSVLDMVTEGVGVVVGEAVEKDMEVARSIIVAALISGASSCRGCGGMSASEGLEGDRIGDSDGEQGEDGLAMEDELALSELGEEQSVSCFDTLRFTLALLFWNQICTRLEDIPN